MPGVEALVALQSDERGLEESGQHLGYLGLPHPRLSLEEERPAQLQGEVDGDGQAAIGDVLALVERFLDGGNVGGKWVGHGQGHVSGAAVNRSSLCVVVSPHDLSEEE